LPPPVDTTPVFFLIGMGDAAIAFNLALAVRMRKAGMRTVVEVENKSMKAQMRSANRVNATAAIICGDTELHQGIVVVKNMRDGNQDEIAVDSLIPILQQQYQ